MPEAVRMPNQSKILYLERVEPAVNMARYYRIELVRDLFDTIQLIRCWGRIGRSSQTLTHSFTDSGDANAAFQAIAQRKQKRGYARVGRGPDG